MEVSGYSSINPLNFSDFLCPFGAVTNNHNQPPCHFLPTLVGTRQILAEWVASGFCFAFRFQLATCSVKAD